METVLFNPSCIGTLIREWSRNNHDAFVVPIAFSKVENVPAYLLASE